MKTHQELNFNELFTVKSFLLMMAGIGFAVFALKGFMIPNGFFDGGVTGISLLIHELWHINFSLLMLSFNMIFILAAYKYISKAFAIRSFIAVLILSLCVEFIHIPAVTTDKLLIAIFGGCFIGLGMGLVVRSGAVIDGFEILAAFTLKKIGFSMSEIILSFNSVIFITAAFKFGFELAMYAIITYYTALKMVDYVVDGIEEYIALTIISKDPESIKSLLVNYFGKGITVYKGERGFLPGNFSQHSEVDIIVTIVTRLEVIPIKEEIEKIDPSAFAYMNSIKETKGGILKKKSGH
jgi:uncharacterized membrane-anchored protein YitT (DUF2179 family)